MDKDVMCAYIYIYIYIGMYRSKYCLTMRRKEIEGIMLNEMSQTEKVQYSMIYMWNLKKI